MSTSETNRQRTGVGYELSCKTVVGRLVQGVLRRFNARRGVTEKQIGTITRGFEEELIRAAAENDIGQYMGREAGAIRAIESLPEEGFSRQVITSMNDRISKLVEPPAGAEGNEWILIEEEKGKTKRYSVSVTEEEVLDGGHVLTEEIVELRSDIHWIEADGRRYRRERLIDSNGDHMLLSLEVSSGKVPYLDRTPGSVKFFNITQWDFDLKREELSKESNVIVVKTPKSEYYISTDELNTVFERNARLTSERGWALSCRDIINILNDAGA